MASTDEHPTVSSTQTHRTTSPESRRWTALKSAQNQMIPKRSVVIVSSRRLVREGLPASGLSSSTPCLAGWQAQVGVTRGQRDKGWALNSVLFNRDQRDACLFVFFFKSLAVFGSSIDRFGLLVLPELSPKPNALQTTASFSSSAYFPNSVLSVIKGIMVVWL